MRFFGKVEY